MLTLLWLVLLAIFVLGYHCMHQLGEQIVVCRVQV
jgi:hypothetical protein